MERVQGCLERDTEASSTARSSSWDSLPGRMGRGTSTSTPILPPPPDPRSDLSLHLGQKRIPVMAFNTRVALISVPPHDPSGCQADPSIWKLSSPPSAQLRPLTSSPPISPFSASASHGHAPSPASLTLPRISGEDFTQLVRARRGIPAPQPLGFCLPSSLWHQEQPGQVNWGLSQKGVCCGLRLSLVLCVAPAM